jgi:hypothetical protein
MEIQARAETHSGGIQIRNSEDRIPDSGKDVISSYSAIPVLSFRC